ncbi:hypothetical protein EKK58_11125 [Candidatus Dependentiae bacterium]|nr:MAG: hypothetical protein EKK58_11125 [Candidatus Dependentiae bacterium]
MAKREEVVYYKRGLIERGGAITGWRWAQGYSSGTYELAEYPWVTKREAQASEKKQGKKAVFVD